MFYRTKDNEHRTEKAELNWKMVCATVLLALQRARRAFRNDLLPGKAAIKHLPRPRLRLGKVKFLQDRPRFITVLAFVWYQSRTDTRASPQRLSQRHILIRWAQKCAACLRSQHWVWNPLPVLAGWLNPYRQCWRTDWLWPANNCAF